MARPSQERAGTRDPPGSGSRPIMSACVRAIGAAVSVSRGPPGPRRHLNTTLPTSWKSSESAQRQAPRPLMRRFRSTGLIGRRCLLPRSTDEAPRPPAVSWRSLVATVPPAKRAGIWKMVGTGELSLPTVPRRDSSQRATYPSGAHPPERPSRSGRSRWEGNSSLPNQSQSGGVDFQILWKFFENGSFGHVDHSVSRP